MLLRPGLLATLRSSSRRFRTRFTFRRRRCSRRKAERIVYVKSGQVRAAADHDVKRSESMMVMSDGVKPGEVIALADPTAKKDKKSQQKKGGAMGACRRSK